MSLISADPMLREMRSLLQPFSRFPVVEEFWNSPIVESRSNSSFAMIHGDLIDKDNCYVLLVECPGMAKNEIDVTVENDSVVVCGNKQSCCEEKEKDWYLCSERKFGRFKRTWKLPSNADFSKSNVVYRDGLLKINIPKLQGQASVSQKLQIL